MEPPPTEPLQIPPFCPVVRQVQQLKEELCSDEFVESLLADYAKDIPVTSAIQVCTSYWPLRLPLSYSLPTDPCVLPSYWS